MDGAGQQGIAGTRSQCNGPSWSARARRAWEGGAGSAEARTGWFSCGLGRSGSKAEQRIGRDEIGQPSGGTDRPDGSMGSQRHAEAVADLAAAVRETKEAK